MRNTYLNIYTWVFHGTLDTEEYSPGVSALHVIRPATPNYDHSEAQLVQQ
jgi:hypothetical protein